MSYFSGHVHTVIFENESQDFYILRVRLDDTSDGAGLGDLDDMFTETVVVKGSIPGLKPRNNTWIGFEGKWIQHEKFGRQIQITRAPVIKEWTAQVAISMLTSHGVGGRVARRMADELKENFVEALDEGDEERLTVPEVTSFMAAHAIAQWQVIKSFHKTLEFLATSGVARGMITKVWAAFGDDAKKVLTENPWAMVEIDGIKFPQCDEVARKIGLSLDSPKRHRGAILYVCKTARGMGHVYMSTGDVRQAAQAFVSDITAREVAVALGGLHKDGKLVIDQKARPGMTAVYEPWLYQMEQESAELLRDRFSTAAFDEDEHVEYTKSLGGLGPKSQAAFEKTPGDLRAVAHAALEDASVGTKTPLSGHQMTAAVNALVEPVSILTGLPGTGKTTTMNVVVNALRDAGARILLIAPTGIAAKRLKTVTGAEAATIHRAFGAKGFSGEERESTYHGVIENPHADKKMGGDGSIEHWACTDQHHPADVVICDEFSMVDQHLMYRILTCTKPTARLVLVGDAAQLPSVGPGNVLREAISSELMPTVNLTDIFRQGDTSDIIMAAHDIHAGRVPEVGRGGDHDFNLIQLGSEDKILGAIVRVAQKLMGKSEFQIISPKHGGTLGVTNLNAKLREVLNPRSPGVHEMKVGAETLREGDRVMVVRNDYELGVFNGDVGKVAALHRRDRVVEIKIHGPPVMHVRVPFKKAGNMLRLAYAMTVHKSQGQEYNVIVMPLVRAFGHQLQRNLLYTGITRAKKKVFMIGHDQALEMAVHNSRVDARNTLFLDRLRNEWTKDPSERSPKLVEEEPPDTGSTAQLDVETQGVEDLLASVDEMLE